MVSYSPHHIRKSMSDDAFEGVLLIVAYSEVDNSSNSLVEVPEEVTHDETGNECIETSRRFGF